MTGLTVLERMEDASVQRTLKEGYGRGMMEMFIRNSPWQTFGTLTVRPDYGNRIPSKQSGMSSDAMKRLVSKLFGKRKLRNIKYLWVIEKHLPACYGGKGGTHAHFLTKDEPTDDAWKNRGWKRAWHWWHEVKGYGTMRTLPVNYDKMSRLAAYLAKYCSKDAVNSDFRFERFTKPEITLVSKRDEGVESVAEDSDEYHSLLRETLDWGRKNMGHAGARRGGSACYRKPTDMKDVVWAYTASSTH